MIGQRLDGKYDILRLIGEGGMGAVYEATVDSGDRCAVKVINDEAVAKDEVLIQRFEREAYAAKKVLSPNIVELLDAGHDPLTGNPYMVMEMLDGENALQLLRRIGPLPPALALRIGMQTCEGLASAHEAGVVHRDIKPANIFVAAAGDDQLVVKLLDFGVAKFKMDQASESDNESLTRTGSMLGSPMYMSPEQARGLKSIDHRADIWSLGVVMHQLMTGKVPHQDVEGLGELIITICSEQPPRVNEHAPWISEEVAEVIAGATKLKIDDRYQDARAFAEAMRACIDGSPEIDTRLVERMSDEDKKPRSSPGSSKKKKPRSSAKGQGKPDFATADTAPADGVVEREKKKAAAMIAAQGGFMALDSTVALADVEEEVRKAEASRDGSEGDTEPPPTAALPDVGGAEPNLAATVAFPLDGIDLPEADTEKMRAAAKRPAPDAKRDARALAKHQEARQAAIQAARLAPAEPSSSSSTVVIAVVVFALFLVGGGVFYFLSSPGVTAPPTLPKPAPTPAPTPSPTPPPSPTPAPAASTGRPAPSASAAAPAGLRLSVSPSYAQFSVRGRVVPQQDGSIPLEGAPGTAVQVKATLGKQSQAFVVKITEAGPVPSSISFHPKPPPKAPATP